MKIFERIKRIFYKNKTKAISTGFDSQKIILIIKKEKNSEVALNILKNYCPMMSSADISEIIVNLAISKRIEAIEIAQNYITPYDLYDIALKNLDYNGKLEVLEKFQYRLDLEDIFGLFNNLPPDQRFTALKKSIDRFDSFGLSEIIQKYIPLYERLDCLNLYHEKLDSFSKARIIEKLDSDRKIEALKQYGNELNKTDLNSIVCNTETNKISEVLNVVYHNLTSKQILNIIQYHIPENEKLKNLYKCCNNLDSSSISDLIKYSIPDDEKEEALVTLQNRIKSNNIGEIIQFCIKSSNILEKVKNNLDIEDIEYFRNNI